MSVSSFTTLDQLRQLALREKLYSNARVQEVLDAILPVLEAMDEDIDGIYSQDALTSEAISANGSVTVSSLLESGVYYMLRIEDGIGNISTGGIVAAANGSVTVGGVTLTVDAASTGFTIQNGNEYSITASVTRPTLELLSELILSIRDGNETSY